jgi:hypothetical protein
MDWLRREYAQHRIPDSQYRHTVCVDIACDIRLNQAERRLTTAEYRDYDIEHERLAPQYYS